MQIKKVFNMYMSRLYIATNQSRRGDLIDFSITEQQMKKTIIEIVCEYSLQLFAVQTWLQYYEQQQVKYINIFKQNISAADKNPKHWPYTDRL